MTYFEDGERSYVIWAQHSPEKISCLYLGEVNREEPWKLISLPMLLTEPEYDWEKVRYAVNEGPAVVKHDGRIMVFSVRYWSGVLCRSNFCQRGK